MKHLAGWAFNRLVIPILAFSGKLVWGQSAAIDITWLPVTEAEMKMKAPVVDKNAGVEALFWRVHVRDEVVGGRDLERVFYNYVRLKIFDEKGKEQAATIDLPFSEKTSIINVAGRTIKPDGTELELKKDSVYERDFDPRRPNTDPGEIVRDARSGAGSHCGISMARSGFSAAPTVYPRRLSARIPDSESHIFRLAAVQGLHVIPNVDHAVSLHPSAHTAGARRLSIRNVGKSARLSG